MSFKEKYREVKRLISLPRYRAMLSPEFFTQWDGKKLKYIKVGYYLQRGLKSKRYFMFLLFDKYFVSR